VADQPEPWLRGPLADVPPLLMPVLFSFAQVREDLARHLEDLTTEQIWQPFAGSSIGYHLKHMAGSLDRLSTYLLGKQLAEIQLVRLRDEHAPGASLPELICSVETALQETEQRLSMIDEQQIYDFRAVGRAQLPTTVLGLLVHLAEHTQRHLGQIITLSQVVRLTTTSPLR
jgi:uncharacterized damage-inducible protein DinB